MIVLRPAFTADAQLLATIAEQAFDPRYGEGWNSAQLVAALDAQDSFAVLAESPEGAAGFSLARMTLDEAELLLVAVRPALRRTGIGRTLLHDVVSRVRSRGGRTLFLEVRDGNAAAVALYRGLSFEEVGRRRAYYAGLNQTRYDAITMRRSV